MLSPLPASTVAHVDESKKPTKDIYNWLKSVSDVILSLTRPASSVTPSGIGELVIEATSNTTLRFKYKGSDGTVRSASLTLS